MCNDLCSAARTPRKHITVWVKKPKHRSAYNTFASKLTIFSNIYFYSNDYLNYTASPNEHKWTLTIYQWTIWTTPAASESWRRRLLPVGRACASSWDCCRSRKSSWIRQAFAVSRRWGREWSVFTLSSNACSNKSSQSSFSSCASFISYPLAHSINCHLSPTTYSYCTRILSSAECGNVLVLVPRMQPAAGGIFMAPPKVVLLPNARWRKELKVSAQGIHWVQWHA